MIGVPEVVILLALALFFLGGLACLIVRIVNADSLGSVGKTLTTIWGVMAVLALCLAGPFLVISGTRYYSIQDEERRRAEEEARRERARELEEERRARTREPAEGPADRPIEESEAPVEVILHDGTRLRGELLGFGDRRYRIRLRSGEVRRVEEVDVREVAFYDPVEEPPEEPAPGTEDEPRSLANEAEDPASEEGRTDPNAPSPAEEAAARGLSWLASEQRPDGSWAAGDPAWTPSATALALLAFASNGHTHRFGDHRDVVRRGLDHLVDLATEEDPRSHALHDPERPGTILNLVLSTLVLCHHHAMSRDAGLLPAAEAGVDACLRTRLDGGGWGEGAQGPPADSWVTGWMLIVAGAAEMAGIEVPEELGDEAGATLVERTGADGRVGRFEAGDGRSVHPGPGEPSPDRPVLTALGLAVAPRLLEVHDRSAGILARTPPGTGGSLDPLYAWIGLHATSRADPEVWEAWHETAGEALRGAMRTEGEVAGSWDPAGVLSSVGGRTTSTALAVMALARQMAPGRSRLGPVSDRGDRSWTCSVHERVRMERSGECPICGRDLVRLGEAGSADDGSD